MKELKGRIVIKKDSGNRCRVTDASENSVEIFVTKDERFYNRKVKCSKCEKVSFLEKNEKFKCSTKIEIVLESGETKKVDCGGKAVDLEKIFTGVDSLQWFEKSWFERFFDVTEDVWEGEEAVKFDMSWNKSNVTYEKNGEYANQLIRKY